MTSLWPPPVWEILSGVTPPSVFLHWTRPWSGHLWLRHAFLLPFLITRWGLLGLNVSGSRQTASSKNPQTGLRKCLRESGWRPLQSNLGANKMNFSSSVCLFLGTRKWVKIGFFDAQISIFGQLLIVMRANILPRSRKSPLSSLSCGYFLHCAKPWSRTLTISEAFLRAIQPLPRSVFCRETSVSGYSWASRA